MEADCSSDAISEGAFCAIFDGGLNVMTLWFSSIPPNSGFDAIRRVAAVNRTPTADAMTSTPDAMK